MAMDDLTKPLDQKLDEPLNDYLTVRDTLKIFTDWYLTSGITENIPPSRSIVSLLAFAYVRGRQDERVEK